MRIYDARIARFLSVDPLRMKFPSWSPYAFAFDNPILNIDLEGLEGVSNAHRLYFINAGIPLMDKVTSAEVGYSALGAAFALGQSAWEAGYGNEADIKRKISANYYWGMKFKNKVISFGSFDAGFNAWKLMMTGRFSGAYNLLKGNFTVDQLEQAINYGTYSYDPLTKGKYVKHMLGNAKNVLKRMLIVIDEQKLELTKKSENLLKDSNGKPISIDNLSKEKKAQYEANKKELEHLDGVRAKVSASIAAVETALAPKK